MTKGMLYCVYYAHSPARVNVRIKTRSLSRLIKDGQLTVSNLVYSDPSDQRNAPLARLMVAGLRAV